MNRFAIIIPSYNSLPWILEVIAGALQNLPTAKVFVVDDNSPDGTGDAIRKKFGRNKRVKLLSRLGKAGRGSAVLFGFQEALGDKAIKSFIEMDADLAHNPQDLPRFVKKSLRADVIIGSKYVPGGGVINQEWSRQVFSLLANFWARLVLGIPIRDYTNGFRCYRRRAVVALFSQPIQTRGFIVLSEIAFRLHQKGYSFTEIPVLVSYQPKKKSNFDFGEVKEAFLAVLRIKFG